jgi:phosphopantetheinyl transferase (holo-ACP synthase)
MSRQIIKKDNGKYAVWSTIIDDFIVDDWTKEAIIKAFGKEAKTKKIKETTDIFEELENGGKPYYQFTITYKEALKTRKEVHGDKNE